MTSSKRVLSTLCVAAAALGAGSAALAQSTSTTSPSSPYYAAGNSYVGVNVGRSDFSLNSGTGLFASEQRDNSYNFAAGTYFDRNFGVELGHTHFGNIATVIDKSTRPDGAGARRRQFAQQRNACVRPDLSAPLAAGGAGATSPRVYRASSVPTTEATTA